MRYQTLMPHLASRRLRIDGYYLSRICTSSSENQQLNQEPVAVKVLLVVTLQFFNWSPGRLHQSGEETAKSIWLMNDVTSGHGPVQRSLLNLTVVAVGLDVSIAVVVHISIWDSVGISKKVKNTVHKNSEFLTWTYLGKENMKRKIEKKASQASVGEEMEGFIPH